MSIVDNVTSLVRSVLGTTNDALLRKLWPTVKAVRALEARFQAMDDTILRAHHGVLKARLAKGETIQQVMPEALALVREVADRRLGMWNALDVKRGFPEDAWGEAKAAVDEARAKLAANTAPWDIDLPVTVYNRIRSLYPESVPPFRMRAHDVQVLGAMVLHQGRIAEMRTGEGKTLVASLTCYVTALEGHAVHVITVNDYLASRDAAWNAPTLRFLGITIGAIQGQMPAWTRRDMYKCDVTYGTNNEFGFDYLRDNLAKSLDEQVQTRRHMAIVDEVDSVLIDEARTPLIISGPANAKKEFYAKAREVALSLEKGPDYEVDIKDRHVTLSDSGIDKASRGFEVGNLYDAEAMHLPHFLDNALKAKELYTRDKEYLVVGDQVKIVDEHTGRVMEGRRWSDGLHQAIEAKEGAAIQEETQTYATITLQNFFRLYDRLAGMTGTAMTEAGEFNAIYKLDVVAIPPNRPVVRADLPDLIFGSEPEKFDAIVKEVEELHAIGQPVLVGTISVEISERLSEHFKRKGVRHEVLNARQHAREAEIVAGAGNFGAVTIATNMAGRGTDIVLGRTTAAEAFKHWKLHGLVPKKIDPTSADLEETVIDCWFKRFLDEKEAAKHAKADLKGKLKVLNDQRRTQGLHPLPNPNAFAAGVDVRQLGGLRILGTERHDSRRIDNQLRGRSGRQGDPGSSRFYLSLDDDLMKRFAGPTMVSAMRRMGLTNGIPLESPMVSRAVEKAQKRVEEYYFGMRKNLLEYDQVANVQRGQIYGQRQKVLLGKDLDKTLLEFFHSAVDDLIQKSAADGTRGPDLAARISEGFTKDTGLPAPDPTTLPVKDGGEAVLTLLNNTVDQAFATRQTVLGDEVSGAVMRFVLLEAIDRRWKDHLYTMEHLRHAIGLEGYAQKDPRLRYKEEGYRVFGHMNELIRLDVARILFRLQVQVNPPAAEVEGPGAVAASLQAGGFAPLPRSEDVPAPQGDKTGPNDPCPCGSGEPFKRCHGK